MEIYNQTKVKNLEPKAIPGRAPRFTHEFTMMVAKRKLEEKFTYREIAEMYDVSHGWINQALKMYKGQKIPFDRRPKEPSPEVKLHRVEAQIQDLKKEIGELYLENKMLKKVLTYSQSLKKENSLSITSENLGQYQEGVK